MSAADPGTYRHTQRGSAPLFAVGGAGLVLLAVAALLARAASSAWPGLILAGLIMVVAASLFSRMTVTVADGSISLEMARGLVRRSWRLTDLQVVRVVHTNWYNGWGIHGWGHNWLYNVSGYGAVELDLANGARAYIGSDEPERLLQSILAARGTQSARHPL
jgi:hypothetical protein